MYLNVEQTKLVESDPTGPMQIKGVAGSGKTTVALHRALYLHKNYCYKPDDLILFVTYNKTLISYLKHIYQKMEKDYREYYANIFSDNEQKVDMNTVDSIIYQKYHKLKGEKALEPIYGSPKSRKILRDCIIEIQKGFHDIQVIDLKHLRFLMDEIDWLKSCNYLDLNEYQQIDRIGRARTEERKGPQRLAKNSKARKAIFHLMRHFDQSLQKQGYIYHKDMALEVYKQTLKKPEKLYKHIIVDEGQDLTRVQLEYLKTLYRNDKDSCFTFVADTAQSIYSHAWLVKGRSFTSLGMDMSGKSSTLTKNYRTSTQAAQAAYSLIEKDKEIIECEDYVPPSLLDQQGQYPVLYSFNTEKEEATSVVESVKKLLAQGYKYNDIVVIARMKKQLECLKEVFEKDGIPCKVSSTNDSSFMARKVQIMTMHSIKGLEYKVVFIIGLNHDVIPLNIDQEQDAKEVQESSERRLLYVGMTRARQLLYLSYWGKPSKFVEDINPKYLRSASGSRIKSFYKVSVDNYLFKSKIYRTYGREEEIRQWVIRELIDTYRYLEKQIEIERRVIFGSKGGAVDVTVNAYHNKIHNFAPMIFIETKAPGENLADGMEQLKSYMAVSQTCQYGVLTDGNVFVVINRDNQIIDDIPLFHQSMLPAGGDIYLYKDLRSKEECIVKVDYDDPNRVMTVHKDIQEDYMGLEAKQLPIFESVAAGTGQLMNEETIGHFCLPAIWFSSGKEMYILQVKGDSMIDAGIDDGDLVVAEQCNDARNRDIVVVAYGDEGVIKRYSPMNDGVLLLSENERYEPMHVKSEQAKILGIVHGVIKDGISKAR